METVKKQQNVWKWLMAAGAVVLILVLGVFYYRGILNASLLFLISVAFYVCDLICVLIWCPFRLIMKNRCCTT